MAETTYQDAPPTILDRTLDLTRIGWLTISAWVVIAIGVALRFGQLNGLALSPNESRWAFQAYSFVRGSTSGPGFELPDTNPAFLAMESLALFLFGATDVVARVAPALLGSGLIILAWLMWPFVGRARALGMAILVAISPTLLYGSRTADPQIAVAFFALLFIVASLRVGLAGSSLDRRRTWAVVAGFALAAAFASGPTSLTVIIALVISIGAGLAFEPNRDGALRRAINGFRTTSQALPLAYLGFIITTVVLFTRFFSDLTAISGVGQTFADWGRLLATTASSTPTQFFLLAILLYEILAVVFAIVAANRRGAEDPAGSLPWPFFVAWFTVSLLIFSFTSGRAPEQAILVALPLVLIGGAGLGDLLTSIDLDRVTSSRTGTLFAAMVGLVIAVIAFIVLVDRARSAIDQQRAVFQAIAVAVLAVAPLAYAVVSLSGLGRAGNTPRLAGSVALAVLALFLGGYTLRSSIELSYYNADDGSELLAQRTSTGSVNALVKRLTNLSRDVTVTDGSPRDPTGGHGLTIGLDRRVQWPLRWYFRDFPDLEIVANGQAPSSADQVVIAPDDAGMAEQGYTPRTYPTLNRVPAVYTAPKIGSVLSSIVIPSRWADGFDYLILRELAVTAPPETIAVGLNGELANRVFPNTGPFNLTDRAGAGNGRGQFNGPRGIAVAPDSGTTYVVDMGNARVERFNEVGEFVGIWGGEDGGVAFERTDTGLGPTGITTSLDGQLIYVCDTWSHRIVVLDQSGREVRTIGAFGDNGDSPDPSIDTELFFGPRDIAVSEDEIYVVDTGNERVQVFGLDGTFKRAFGGLGTEPGQLTEPVGIALGPDGRVYVADSGNARIAVFAEDGTPLEQWPVDAWADQKYFEPYLTFGLDGNLYATSSATGSVEVFDPTGLLIDSITQVGSEQLQQPIGITDAPDGSILITDIQRSAVLRYAAPAESLLPGDDDEVIDEGIDESIDEEPEPAPDASPEPIIELPPASPAASSVASPIASPAASPAASPIASPIGG